MNNNDIVNPGFSLNMILDKAEEDVKEILKNAGHECRVIERDGKALVVTKDFHAKRVGLVIVDGVVSSYKMG